MDSAQCSLFLITPQDTLSPVFPYIDMLRSVFKQVGVIQDDDLSLRRKYPNSTLFFLDLDLFDDDQASISSSGSTCTFTMDNRLTWAKRITQSLAHHPVIVCSSETNSSFMLDCLHAGAADYLLKPLYLPVIQTLFLKLHRRQETESAPAGPTPSSNQTTPLDLSTSSPANELHLDDDYVFLQHDDVHHRVKNFVSKDNQLTKAMMDIYAPPLPFPAKYIPLSSRQADELKQKLDSWDFSPFDYHQDELIHCVYLMFEMAMASPDLAHIIWSQDQWYDFIIDLANAYHDDNPYHNFAHAVDVMQCMYYLLCQLNCFPHKQKNKKRTAARLTGKQVFSILLSAIGHDAGHPGVNNMFLINSRTPLAVMYNDRSVLESLHSMTLFQLIKKHRLDQNWTPDDYQQFRQTIISSILATDMALNNDYVSKFRHATAATDDPMLLCSALIKCADISNVTRPFARGRQWALLLVEEFASQGDLEKELGMPVQPTNDRTKIVLEDFQISFIRFVALDLFNAVVTWLPELGFTVEQMKQNLQQWEFEKQQRTCQSLPTTTFANTTAGTKRRLSYCLEASTPPSLINGFPTSTTPAPTFSNCHFPDDSASKKSRFSPASSPTPTLSTASTASSTSSCVLQ